MTGANEQLAGRTCRGSGVWGGGRKGRGAGRRVTPAAETADLGREERVAVVDEGTWQYGRGTVICGTEP